MSPEAAAVAAPNTGAASPTVAQAAPPASPSQTMDFEGAATVEQPPAKGEYDTTIIDFTIMASQPKLDPATNQPIPTLGAYAKLQLQLDTEPSKGRQVFDMALLLLSGGEVVGTPAAFARNYQQGNVGTAILKQLGIPLSVLQPAILQARTMPPKTGVRIDAAIGKSFRGFFKHEKDDRDPDVPKLRLARVVGKPTGKGFTAAMPAAKNGNGAAERF